MEIKLSKNDYLNNRTVQSFVSQYEKYTNCQTQQHFPVLPSRLINATSVLLSLSPALSPSVHS